MHEFSVWATVPQRVELALGDQRFPMSPGKSNWWTVQVESARLDGDYGFVLDGEGPFPYPRSARQPAGIHSLSRVVEHQSFRWGDAGFHAPPLSKAVIYELH